MESRNAKFLENDLISGSDQLQSMIPEREHSDAQPSTSSDRLIIVHSAPQDQTGIIQPVVEIP